MVPPRPVRDLAERLRVSCSTTPVVEWDVDLAHWRITVSNDRVVMILDHKMTPGGRWVWASSTLTVDGVQGPLASDYDHFVRVWHNPEELANRDLVPPPVSTPIEVVPLELMPSHIASSIDVAVKFSGLSDPVVGYVDDHFWAMEFSSSRMCLRVHWPMAEGSSPKPYEHLFLVIDGEDKSDLVQGRLEKAFAAIAQIPHPGVAGPAGVNDVAGASRDRGVEVRSTHVIRT